MSVVNCDNVCVQADQYGGYGAFAKCNIKKNDIVEYGLARLVDCDGHNNPYLFTWSEDRTKWATCSGCSTFYNTSLNPNTKMVRDFVNNTFKIIAVMDINKGDQLTHKYKSLEWRKAFENLNKTLQS